MNISLYLEPPLLKALEDKAKEQGKKRNAAIREAVERWLQNGEAEHVEGWPHILTQLGEGGNLPPFEAHRKELMTFAEATA